MQGAGKIVACHVCHVCDSLKLVAKVSQLQAIPLEFAEGVRAKQKAWVDGATIGLAQWKLVDDILKLLKTKLKNHQNRQHILCTKHKLL